MNDDEIKLSYQLDLVYGEIASALGRLRSINSDDEVSEDDRDRSATARAEIERRVLHALRAFDLVDV